MLRLLVGIFLISLPAMAVEEWLPAPKYDRPYKGKTVVTRENCPGARDSLACSWVLNGVCHIAISKSITGPRYDAVFRHERGHCNGMPGEGTRAVRF
jgi:hypothetical protein